MFHHDLNSTLRDLNVLMKINAYENFLMSEANKFSLKYKSY